MFPSLSTVKTMRKSWIRFATDTIASPLQAHLHMNISVAISDKGCESIELDLLPTPSKSTRQQVLNPWSRIPTHTFPRFIILRKLSFEIRTLSSEMQTMSSEMQTLILRLASRTLSWELWAQGYPLSLLIFTSKMIRVSAVLCSISELNMLCM